MMMLKPLDIYFDPVVHPRDREIQLGDNRASSFEARHRPKGLSFGLGRKDENSLANPISQAKQKQKLDLNHGLDRNRLGISWLSVK